MTQTQPIAPTFTSLREKIAHEKAERLADYARFEAMLRTAYAVAQEAGERHQPSVMQVLENGRVIDTVLDGPCGFAWVTIRPGTSRFARWAVANGHARKSYGGGVQLWVSAFNQSYERKMAAAEALADCLRMAGIKAYASGRLD